MAIGQVKDAIKKISEVGRMMMLKPAAIKQGVNFFCTVNKNRLLQHR